MTEIENQSKTESLVTVHSVYPGMVWENNTENLTEKFGKEYAHMEVVDLRDFSLNTIEYNFKRMIKMKKDLHGQLVEFAQEKDLKVNSKVICKEIELKNPEINNKFWVAVPFTYEDEDLNKSEGCVEWLKRDIEEQLNDYQNVIPLRVRIEKAMLMKKAISTEVVSAIVQNSEQLVDLYYQVYSQVHKKFNPEVNTEIVGYKPPVPRIPNNEVLRITSNLFNGLARKNNLI